MNPKNKTERFSVSYVNLIKALFLLDNLLFFVSVIIKLVGDLPYNPPMSDFVAIDIYLFKAPILIPLLIFTLILPKKWIYNKFRIIIFVLVIIWIIYWIIFHPFNYYSLEAHLGRALIAIIATYVVLGVFCYWVAELKEIYKNHLESSRSKTN